jgi:hypothetical protein
MKLPTYMVGACSVRAGSPDPKKRAKMRRSELISSIERLSFGGQPHPRLARTLVGPVLRTKGLANRRSERYRRNRGPLPTKSPFTLESRQNSLYDGVGRSVRQNRRYNFTRDKPVDLNPGRKTSVSSQPRRLRVLVAGRRRRVLWR